ncbi:MAG TPA: protein translocase subunit SecF [Ktedonobacteraceae bacterium]|nr:protein translocase subunit SecF [Ktedonobacteraceae bacterium]
MFNLVGKRYIFLIISLIVIIPGTISLIVKGLDVGIDFAGGATVEFRPEKTLTDVQVQNLVKPLNLDSLEIQTGNDPSVAANQTIWIRLNTNIDTNVQAVIQEDLQTKYGKQLSVVPLPLVLGGKTVTVITVTKFNSGVNPKISDIETLLKKLPDTSNPAIGPPTATATPAASPTATATSTSKATPTSTPKATATPGATATGTSSSTGPVVHGTPTATPTPSTTKPNPANIPVSVVDVRQGTTTQTITLLTRSDLSQNDLLKLQALFINSGNNYIQLLNNASVSGSVASDTTRNAFLAVLAASVLILLYIWFSFRKVAKPWRYGACAIIALLHDVLVVLGVFSFLGWIFHVQVDALFLTALLTVVGFSVHDTIVVFDRIRENMQRRTSETFEQVVNASLVQTMARSLNTSLTVLFTLSALTLFGGDSIRTFTGALLVGIFSGTYSSIFNASMLLVIWEKGELGFNRLGGGQPEPDRREARELARTRG